MMNIREILRLALFPVLLFPASAYAVPIFQANLTGVAGEAYFSKYNDIGIRNVEADKMLISVSPLWNGNTGRNSLLSGSHANGFASPYGFNSAFAAQLLDPDISRAILSMFSAGDTEIDSGILSSNHADEVAEFLAALGILLADWQVTEEDSFAPGQQDSSAPGSFIPTITRQEPRNECLQRYYWPLQKPGLRENSCPEAGGAVAGGGMGGRGSISAIGGKTGSGFGPGPAPGIGSGGPSGPGSGDGGPGGPSGPGTDTGGGGSSGPGTDNGNGGDSGGGNGDIGDVRTVPEPTTLALIGFGIAGMFMARRHKR